MKTDKTKPTLPNGNHSHCFPIHGLSTPQTCFSGILMGSIGYTGSFSVVPLFFTVTALSFGSKSLITIFATAFSQLLAGYLHTHASRTGIAISTTLFGGFYIAKPVMSNRRKYGETRWSSLKRFFISEPVNALVLNLMWETFTVFYLLQSALYMRCVKYGKQSASAPTPELERNLILFFGFTRFLAGCLSGASTGMINQLWQRHLACLDIPLAVFNVDKKKLKLRWLDRKKLLSVNNMENWIKASTMLAGALFTILSHIPNATGWHSLSVPNKKLLIDLLVIHGGWLFIRDGQMLLLKKQNKPPNTPNPATPSPIPAEQEKMIVP